MFTRAVISDEISQELDLAAAMAQRFGLDQLELRTAWDVRIDDMTPEHLRRVRDIAAHNGLGVVCLATPFLKCDIGNTDDYQEHLMILRRSIAAAHALGAKIIRTFSFWKHGDLAPNFGAIVRAYAEPARIAAAEGVTLGV
jgi:sugar phosphate isomerase/epimerase